MEIKSNFSGSETTKSLVASQIRERWGEEAANRYDPYTNCLPFRKWSEAGYRIKAGEKAIRSLTYVEVKDQDGVVLKKWPKNIYLFFIDQVERVS